MSGGVHLGDLVRERVGRVSGDEECRRDVVLGKHLQEAVEADGAAKDAAGYICCVGRLGAGRVNPSARLAASHKRVGLIS